MALKLAAWPLSACLIAGAVVRLSAQTPVAPYCTEPSVAPNRAEIAFISGGDIWTAPLAGGEAHLLVSHPAVESRPLYSPDGTRLAFVSERTGGGDIYVLQLSTGALKRITFDDGREQLDAWSRDGKWLYYSSTAQDVAGSNDIFRVSAEGGTPMPVSADRYVNEFSAAPFARRRRARHDRPRRHQQPMVAARPRPYRRIGDLAGDAGRREGSAQISPARRRRLKSLWPMWSADGARVYFVSDCDGSENIWQIAARGAAQPPR